MANVYYTWGRAKIHKGDGTVSLSSDTLKAILVGSGYTPNPDHRYVDEGGGNDVIDHEISGTGYVAGHGNSGRRTLANVDVSVDDTANTMTVYADPAIWSGYNAGSVAKVVIAKEGTSDDTDAILISSIDTGFPILVTLGELQIPLDDGFLTG